MALFGRHVKDDLVPAFHCRSGSSTSSLALKLCMGQPVVLDLPGQVPLTAACQDPPLLLWGFWRCNSMDVGWRKRRMEGWEEDLPREWGTQGAAWRLGAVCPVRNLCSLCPCLNDSCWQYGVGMAIKSLLFGSGSLQMGQCLK